MADLIAYTGYMQLNQHSGIELGWTSFEDFLGPKGTLDAIQRRARSIASMCSRCSRTRQSTSSGAGPRTGCT